MGERIGSGRVRVVRDGPVSAGSRSRSYPVSGAPAGGPVRPSPTFVSSTARRRGQGRRSRRAAAREPLTPPKHRGPLGGRWIFGLAGLGACIHIGEQPIIQGGPRNAGLDAAIGDPIVADRLTLQVEAGHPFGLIVLAASTIVLVTIAGWLKRRVVA
jgi:hypothetical protein